MSYLKGPYPHPRNRSAALRYSAILFATFLVVFGLIVWFTEGNNLKSKQNDLNSRARTFSGSLQLTLEGDASYLELLALDRASGKLTPQLFQERAGQYVQAHPQLINITWVDADFYITDVAPLAQNRQIVGLQLNLPEPKRVSALARQLRKPVYTRPFEAIQGNTSFEVWVPVFRGDTFLGLFGGIYSCNNLLQQLVAHTQPRLYHLSLTDQGGRLLATMAHDEPLDRHFTRESAVTDPESGVMLRVTRYQGRSDWRLYLLKSISLLLVMGMFYTLWNLKLEIEERKQAEEEIKKQAALLEEEISERQVAQESLQEQAALLEEEVSERWQAEEALRESEERLRLLLDSTGEAIYGIDIDGNCTFCNRACLRMLGYEKDTDLLGKNIHGIMHHSYPDGRHMPQEECGAHRNMLQGKGSHADDEVFWRCDGTSFPVEYWSYPQVKGGKVVGAVVAFINTTERRHLEEQFRQSQKMESIGRLAGGVAHDFNNMLSVISGAAELSKRKLEDGEPIGQYLELIINAARRSSDITRQLLAFSRKEVVSPKPVQLNRQIEDSIKILTRLISEDVKLTFHPAPELWSVLIAPSQVDQILMNLAVNARDAMPEGGSLAIETANVQIPSHYAYLHPEARPGDYVQLSVSDTGHGMDKATAAHIFEPFFTTKGQGKGTGLGLSTVYGIVTQNGGFINVYSEPGQGAVFKVYLPRLQESPAPPQGDRPEGGPLSGTVLLVEDEEMLLWLTTRLLEEMGLTVIQAQSPLEALEISRQRGAEIDLVLTDVVMPEMNGRELAERIRESLPRMKVLFMSGHTSDNVIRRGVIEAGMHFIQKPLEMEKLKKTISEMLAERQEA
ncbi:hybrid sensor histidine kinase/response regulator [Geomonas azotofigens]|uniref:hybrid sensor histidine kinase/response regulator n=1 Tax=Geomonas azotofigens TaxID=2843196 RepID=UPI001C0F5216|nr:response regulator [Geomonas azotofigens]MBU5614759.1 response regulator [Geomonas azotofigens]